MTRSIINGFRKNKFLTILIIFYLLTRLTQLKSLPIFNDEATYIDWAWRMINLKGQFFYSVAHAKPPLFMWVVGIVRKVITDPLLAGRLVAIFGGFLTVIGIYKLAQFLFNKNVALLATLLFIIIPIFVFYDRQALMESSVTAAGVWTFFFFLKLIKTQKYKYAAFLGITLGLGYLVKTNTILYLIPLIFLYFLNIRKSSKDRDIIVSNGIITISAFLISVSPLLLNSIFWETLANNKDYIFTISELAKFPFTSWLKNLKDFTTITLMYLNPITVAFALISIFQNLKTKSGEKLYTAFYLISGWVFIILLSRSLIPRHAVSFLPITLIFTADFIVWLWKKTKPWTILASASVIIPSLTLTTLLIFFPIKYFYSLDKISPFSLKVEYVTHWSSGYGVDEVVGYLEQLARNTPIIVGVRLDAGIPENAVFAYFQGSEKVIPIYFDSRMILDFGSYDCIKSRIPAYFVSRDDQLAGLNNHLEELKRVYKPEGEHYIGIHKIKTDCTGKKTLNLY